MERRALALRRFLGEPVELRRRRLIETRLVGQAEEPDRLEHSQRSHRVDVGRVFRALERHGDVTLRAEVVDLVRLNFLEDARQVAAVGQIAVVQHEVAAAEVRILVDVVDPFGVQRRGATLDPVHLVSLFRSGARPDTIRPAR